MRLEEVSSVVPVSIHRDSEFESLGTLAHDKPRMLVFIESTEFLPQCFDNQGISSVITTKELAGTLPRHYGVAVSDNPRREFYNLHNYLATNTDLYWKDFYTEISDEAVIHPDAHIAEKNVRVGRGTIIEPGVTVLQRVLIGEGVILRAGCTIGSQGFQFQRREDPILGVVHAGGVLLGDRVEIQGNSVISPAVFGGFTEIGADTKLGTLVYVSHNARIGMRCLIAPSARILGSATIGDDVWIGPGVCISDEISVGNQANVTIGSVVTRNVEPGQRVTGNFAIPHHKFIAFLKSIR